MNPLILDREVITWLGSLGYQPDGKSTATLVALFLQEAQQWGLSPIELVTVVKSNGASLSPDHTGASAQAWSSRAA